MSSVTQKLITAEEFARLPEPADGSKQELVQGEVVTMPPPKGRHGLCCSKIDRRLGTFAETHKRGHVCSNDTGFIIQRNPDTLRGPDVAFWSFERLPVVPDSYIEVAPDLAVEVQSSPKDLARILAKLEEYFARGVRLAWVVDPANRTLTVYRSAAEGRTLHEDDLVTGEEVLPGFSCIVKDLLP